MKYYIVWNATRSIGIVTLNAVIASELEKGIVNFHRGYGSEILETMEAFVKATDGALRFIETIDGEKVVSLRLFDEAWQVLENEGFCDALGGREYNRVRGEYACMGCEQHNNVNVFEFIKARANDT